MIIGSEIISTENLSSTNSHATFLMKNTSLKEGTIISTGFQSSGRGQAGNGWESEAGKNLLMSIVLYPRHIEASGQFVISMMVSLALYDFLSAETKNVSIKWPNDIYVKNDKIAGILIENSLMGNTIESCIIGIGLNVNQTLFTSNAPNPVSLKQITGKNYDLQPLLRTLAADLDKRYIQVSEGRFGEIRSEYNSKLFRKGEWCQWKDKSGLFKGRIVSADHDGTLTIEGADKEKRSYSFKEVEVII